MSAKCRKCGLPIFDEGHSYGTQQDDGTWLCDGDCDPELVEEFNLLEADPLGLVLDDMFLKVAEDNEVR